MKNYSTSRNCDLKHKWQPFANFSHVFKYHNKQLYSMLQVVGMVKNYPLPTDKRKKTYNEERKEMLQKVRETLFLTVDERKRKNENAIFLEHHCTKNTTVQTHIIEKTKSKKSVFDSMENYCISFSLTVWNYTTALIRVEGTIEFVEFRGYFEPVINGEVSQVFYGSNTTEKRISKLPKYIQREQAEINGKTYYFNTFGEFVERKDIAYYGVGSSFKINDFERLFIILCMGL